MWWWGPCAGASCCVGVVATEPHGSLYDELVPLEVDRLGRRRLTRAGSDDDDDDDDEDDDDEDVDDEAEDDDDRRLLGPNQRPTRDQLRRRGRPQRQRQKRPWGHGPIPPGIYSARDVRTHDRVALKVFDKALLRRTEPRRRIRQELRVLALCRDHPHILRLYGVYAHRKTFEIAFELAQGGEVLRRVLAAARPDPLLGRPRYVHSEHEVARVVAAAVSALQFLHAREIVHGELRPEHLLYSDTEPDARVLVVDFGRASQWATFTFASRTAPASSSPSSGRPRFLWDDPHGVKFLPPFAVRRREDRLRSWAEGQRVDTWALGVTMYLLLCARFPFDEDDALLDPTTAAPPALPRELSRAARDLLLRLLDKDPARALSIDEISEHPWIDAGVASSVPWGPERLAAHAAFADAYALEVAAASRRRRRHRRHSHEQEPEQGQHSTDARPAYAQHRILRHQGPEPGECPSSDESLGERPSFVSTDGNVVGPEDDDDDDVFGPGGDGRGDGNDDGRGRLSADAYMRLASAELELLADKPETGVTASNQQQQEQGQQQQQRPPVETPVIRGEMWPVFPKQRRLFSFRNLSFRSSSTSSSSSSSAKDESSVVANQ